MNSNNRSLRASVKRFVSRAIHALFFVALVGVASVRGQQQQLIDVFKATDTLPSSSIAPISAQAKNQSSNKSDEGTQPDEPEFIVPSRPSVSNPAEFQRPGVLQLEYGYEADFRARDVRLAQSTPLALRFAISRRLLFEFDNAGITSQATPDGPRETGIGDTQLGLQGVVVHETQTHPALAFAYYIKLPTASTAKNLGTGRVDHNFIALISKNINEKTVVDFNAGYLLAGRQNESGYASSGQAALALTRNLTRRFSLQGELSGYSRNNDQSGAMFALGAAAYQLNRRVVLDGGATFGLTPDAPRVGLITGITVGLADLYRKNLRK